MELIDKDALIKELGIDRECECCQYVVGDYLCGCDISQADICEAIAEAPTIEVPKWIPLEIRPTDDEEREYFKSDTVLVGTLPDDGDEILVSKGKHVWLDTFVSDGLGVWLDSYGEIEDGMAWMPLPKPYEETDHE